MIQTEYPTVPRFTADQLCAAYDEQAGRGWTGDLGRSAAAMALVGHQAPCELVEYVAGMIRQAVEERGPK